MPLYLDGDDLVDCDIAGWEGVDVSKRVVATHVSQVREANRLWVWQWTGSLLKADVPSEQVGKSVV